MSHSTSFENTKGGQALLRELDLWPPSEIRIFGLRSHRADLPHALYKLYVKLHEKPWLVIEEDVDFFPGAEPKGAYRHIRPHLIVDGTAIDLNGLCCQDAFGGPAEGLAWAMHVIAERLQA
jgi:hypothetical protein